MAIIAVVIEKPPADLPPHEILETSSGQGKKPPPHGDKLMEQILESLCTMPRNSVLKRIASLPRARQKAILEIRHKLTEGTYAAEDRLDEAMDRVLGLMGD
jgi:hypothetical protein